MRFVNTPNVTQQLALAEWERAEERLWDAVLDANTIPSHQAAIDAYIAHARRKPRQTRKVA